MRYGASTYQLPESVWEIAEEWCHELVLKEESQYLDTDYEAAQLQLQFDFAECIDLD